MFCKKCGNLTFFKKICNDCAQNEALFQGLPLRSRSGGFAFVRMSNDEETAKAIAALNEKEVDGRALNVNETCHKAVAGDTPAMIIAGPHDNGANRAGGRQRNAGAAGDFSRPQHDARMSLR